MRRKKIIAPNVENKPSLEGSSERVSNSTWKEPPSSPLDGISVSKHFVPHGMLQSKQCMISEDYVCSTNVLSKYIMRQNQWWLDVQKCRTVIKHYSRPTTEKRCEMLLNATILISHHIYTSNWAVLQSWYEVMIGLVLHYDVKPSVYYDCDKYRWSDKKYL